VNHPSDADLEQYGDPLQLQYEELWLKWRRLVQAAQDRNRIARALGDVILDLERTDKEPSRPPRQDGKPSRTIKVRLRIAAQLKAIINNQP
jgi:hypothetical protein